MRHDLVALTCIVLLIGLFSNGSAQGYVDVPGEIPTVIVVQGDGVFGISSTDVGWVLLLPDPFFTYNPIYLDPPIKVPGYPPFWGGGSRPEEPSPGCVEAQEEFADRSAMLAYLESMLSAAISDPKYSAQDIGEIAQQINIVKEQIKNTEDAINELC